MLSCWSSPQIFINFRSICQGTHKQLAHCRMTFASPFQSSVWSPSVEKHPCCSKTHTRNWYPQRDATPMCAHTKVSKSGVGFMRAFGIDMIWHEDMKNRRIDISPVKVQGNAHSSFCPGFLWMMRPNVESWCLALMPHWSYWRTGMGRFRAIASQNDQTHDASLPRSQLHTHMTATKISKIDNNKHKTKKQIVCMCNPWFLPLTCKVYHPNIKKWYLFYSGFSSILPHLPHQVFRLAFQATGT